jgi:aryl-alcohol dehydrogenase-like predicted oxidoreductase
VLADVAKQRGVWVAQVAIDWLLRKPGPTSVIVRARRREQLVDNLAAATWQLPPDDGGPG